MIRKEVYNSNGTSFRYQRKLCMGYYLNEKEQIVRSSTSLDKMVRKTVGLCPETPDYTIEGHEIGK